MNFDLDWGRWVFGFHAPHIYLGPWRWTRSQGLTDPVFNSAGYPTAQTLRTIRCWKRSVPELFDFLQKSWRNYGYFEHLGGGVFEVSVGGWVDNRELIEALRENRTAWVLCLVTARSGGYYTFKVPNYEEAETV